MKISLSISIVFTLISFWASAQTAKADTEKFIGRWASNDTGRPMEVSLKADGSGVVDGDHAKWNVQKPGLITVTINGDTKTYNYVFKSDGFTVSGADLDGPLNFKKVIEKKSSDTTKPKN